jgi:voltage-gated potassium channel|tara:strand:+ start:1184 stop:2182 length:999 start_codon:yes stop_codon:yes gene_type:complete
MRKRTAEILATAHQGDRLSFLMDLFLMILISLNILAIIMESVDSFEVRFRSQLYLFELFSVAVFSMEYIARLWSCVDLPSCTDDRPIAARIRHMLTPMALVDLIAILPFYLSMAFSIDLRFLRVFRLLRIFKLTRYSGAMNVLLSVLREEASSFVAAFFVLFVLLILTSSGIYVIEHEVQPEAFGSIPAAMWWAMSTLTTVGYGDVTPITPMGKLFGGCITIIGMGMVALPAGILASGFSSQLSRSREAYNVMLDDVLEDGELTNREEQSLEELRHNLGISAAEASQLLHLSLAKGIEGEPTCPSCGESILPQGMRATQKRDAADGDPRRLQ